MKIVIQRVWIDQSAVGFGVTALTAFAREIPCPVGVMWVTINGPGNAGKRRAEILDVWVSQPFRRQGIAGKMLDYLIKTVQCDVVITQNGSKTGGEAWLLAAGFTLDRRLGLWSLTARRKKR